MVAGGKVKPRRGREGRVEPGHGPGPYDYRQPDTRGTDAARNVSAVRTLHPATVAIAAGREQSPGAPLNVPVVAASTYRAGGSLEYGRAGNRTWLAFEEAIGALEGGMAVAFASGMAAIDALVRTLGASVVVYPQVAYFGTGVLLEDYRRRGGLELRGVDVTNTRAVLDAAQGADLVIVESPTNPLLDLADIPALCDGVGARSAALAVDNTLATPFGQTPLATGADVVIHSVSKWIGGHSDLVMGCLITRDSELHAALVEERERSGAVPGALEAFLALRGLRTLSVRMERAERSARELAERLVAHPAVERLRYPGSGGMLAIEVAGGGPAAEAVIAALDLIVSATSLGGVETLIERRARYPEEQAAGVSEGLLRLSIGCEHPADLWNDLEQALASSGGSSRPASP